VPFWQLTFTAPNKIQASKHVRWVNCVGCWRMSYENKAIWRRKWRNMTEYLAIKTAKVRSRVLSHVLSIAYMKYTSLGIAWFKLRGTPKSFWRGCAARISPNFTYLITKLRQKSITNVRYLKLVHGSTIWPQPCNQKWLLVNIGEGLQICHFWWGKISPS